MARSRMLSAEGSGRSQVLGSCPRGLDRTAQAWENTLWVTMGHQPTRDLVGEADEAPQVHI